ncbi:V4R domain-containing protein [Pseudoxanthomonas wuyuanensis]
MVELELKIVSEHRDGLLIALGEVLIANRFALLRHRRTNTGEGVLMSLIVQGPEANQLQLEEQLGTHWMVKGFEAGPHDPTAAAGPLVAAIAIPSAPAQPPPPPSAEAAVAGNGKGAIEQKRIEALLPQVAREYPQIFGLVMGLDRHLEPSQREATLRYVGTRVGAWVYKRDFALGAPLPLTGAIKHIALPAMRQLMSTEAEGDALFTAGSPFCAPDHPVSAPQCHFLRGFLEGTLNESAHLGHVRVSETACRANGDAACKFVFHV